MMTYKPSKHFNVTGNFSALFQPLSKPGAEDTEAMMQRNIALDLLYYLDKRDDPKHPHHHTYTGLWQKYNSDANNS